MSILAGCISVLHVLLIIFIIVVPFYPRADWMLLVLHVSSVMTLVVHWMLNNDGCFLTLVESRLRGIDDTESFMHRIVSPVYKIDDLELKSLVSNITPLLGLVSLLRLIRSRDVIKSDLRELWGRM